METEQSGLFDHYDQYNEETDQVAKEETTQTEKDSTKESHQTYSTKFTMSTTRNKSSQVAGATDQQAIYSTCQIVLHDTIVAFLSYVKTHNIPILPVTKPDIRTVLGQGASFLVNGCEMPKDYADPANGNIIPQGTVVAMKRARIKHGMTDAVANRIRVIYNELLTMNHAPLAAHPNIVKLLGVGFETEGPSKNMRSVPILIPEVAELGNLADVLETARKEERPLEFDEKLSLCLDVAHGLEILHACDIVHGDVKCENILVFERDNRNGPEGPENFKLHCKLTDFGAVQLPSGNVAIGGSRPWQAPEIRRETSFKVEEAKRTDIYGYGMLVWRTFLDGNPFDSLGPIEGDTNGKRRTNRNNKIAKKKHDNELVPFVCDSLATSGKFTNLQRNMLCDVIKVTLLNDAKQRELSLPRIMRMLSVDGWYGERHPITPARMEMDPHLDLIDIDKWYSEFESMSPVIQGDILASLRDYAFTHAGMDKAGDEAEERCTAAYQVAICCANGFGGQFLPEEGLKALQFAAEQGSQKAQLACKSFEDAFPHHDLAFVNPFSKDHETTSNATTDTSSWVSIIPTRAAPERGLSNDSITKSVDMTWLEAAQTGNYHALNRLLDARTKPSTSRDGVTPVHFLSSWDIQKAEELGPRLVEAGFDVNAVANKGSTVGGTPLMWSVYGDHFDHSTLLLKLGAEPIRVADTGEDALSFAARLHLADHLRLLMDHIRPADLRTQLGRLFEAASGGESRFKRITRHGSKWQTAALDVFVLLKKWSDLVLDTSDLTSLITSAIHAGAFSPYGRVNTDVQVAYIRKSSVDPKNLAVTLGESVRGFNKDLFDALLDYGVPIDTLFEQGRNLLHLCGRIPDHTLAATEFAPKLLERGIALERKDARGLTPWMDAVLERKWDLADLFSDRGANALETDNDGFNIIGLCIQTVNLGALKFLLKYGKDQEFNRQFFMVNNKKQITSVQLAASLPLPRAHGMKVEVMGTFYTILTKLVDEATETSQINFRSDGILPNSTALAIAASKGVVHAVRHLVKRHAALPDKAKMAALSREAESDSKTEIEKTNLKRCIYIIENFQKDPDGTTKLAEYWTNLKTIDESKVDSSWENVSWGYKDRRGN